MSVKADIEANLLHEFLLAEYSRLGAQLAASEAEGERRLTTFLTAIAGVAALVGFLLKDGSPFLLPSKAGFAVLLGGILLLLFFGHLTARRLGKRDITSDRLKAAIDEIQRVYVRDRTGEFGFVSAFYRAGEPAPDMPKAGQRDNRRLRGSDIPDAGWVARRLAFLGDAGWLVSTLVLNALLAGAFVAVVLLGMSYVLLADAWWEHDLLLKSWPTSTILGLGIGAAYGAWRVQRRWANDAYAVGMYGMPPIRRDRQRRPPHEGGSGSI